MEDTGERLIPEGHTKSLTYGEHLSRYLSVLDATNDKVVLDIASGAGYGTNLIASIAKQVTGIDYSDEAIAYASNLYSASNLRFVKGDAQNLPVEDASVDVVVSLETIEHLPEPETFVKEVKRVLKPDGVFIVSTPNDDEYIEGNDFHLHEFDLAELQRLMSKYFSSARYYYQGSYFAAGVYEKTSFENPTEGHAQFAKTFGQDTDKAIYFLASASDATPAPLSDTTVIADTWSAKHDQAVDANRQAEKVKLMSDLKGTKGENKELLKEVKQLTAYIGEIENSRAWRLVTRLRSLKSNLRR